MHPVRLPRLLRTGTEPENDRVMELSSSKTAHKIFSENTWCESAGPRASPDDVTTCSGRFCDGEALSASLVRGLRERTRGSWKNGGRVCKPDSVLRVSLTATRRDDHSSGPRIAERLMQPTRGSSPASCEAGCGPDQPSPPIWPCTARGLPCLERRRPSGGLLPHLFTLTVRVPTYSNVPWFCHEPSTVRDAPAVFSLWHFPWPLP